jgi:hypothetical protein
VKAPDVVFAGNEGWSLTVVGAADAFTDVGEDEGRRAVHRVAAAPSVGDLVRPAPEDEGTAPIEHALNLCALGAGLGPKDDPRRVRPILAETRRE